MGCRLITLFGNANHAMKHLSHVDLHVVAALLFLVPLALLILPLGLALLVVAVIPQGFILTHAGDLRRSKHPAAPYVFANQLVVLLVVASCWAGWSFLRSH
jgi:hypothetical protein